MTRNQIDHYRKELLTLGQRLKGDVSNLEDEAYRKTGGEASGNLSNTPLHLADLGSDAFEQEVALSLLQNQEQHLEEIAAALERIRQGSYGRCERCGQEIPHSRLQAVPYVRHCVDCARELQDRGVRIDNPGNLA
jgi:RNA polymerase-binding transcription factor DksA